MQQKFRKGDIVTIKAKVLQEFENSERDITLKLELEGRYDAVWMPASKAIMVTPYFEIGEKVVVTETGLEGEVIGRHGEQVWVAFPDVPPVTFDATQLSIKEERLYVVAA